MKKTILTNLRYIAFGLVLAFGISALAQWTNPLSGTPGASMGVPLHTGPSQIKGAGLSVNNFLVSQNAQFAQNLALKGVVRSGNPADTSSIVSVGDASLGVVTNALISGNLATTAYVQSGSLANTGLKAVCADTHGVLNLCTTDLCTNIAGTQSEVPQGHIRNFNGACEASQPRHFYSKIVNQKIGIKLRGEQGSYILQNTTNPYGNSDVIQAYLELDDSNRIVDGLGGFLPKHALALKIKNPELGNVENYDPLYWTVQDSGTYHIEFASSGNMSSHVQKRGSFWTSVEFFMEIKGEKIPLAPKRTHQACGTVPTANDPGFQFWLTSSCTDHRTPTSTADTSFNFDFKKTAALQAGDTVKIYAEIRGRARKDSFWTNGTQDMDVSFTLYSTTLEVKKQP